MFSYSKSSNTVVKCSFTSSIQHMTINNEFHRVGQFFLLSLELTLELEIDKHACSIELERLGTTTRHRQTA